MNIPMILTLARMALIPAIVLAYYLPFRYGHSIAAMIFILAAITDFVDGYLARSWNQTTRLGAFLDPVADKLVIVIALVLVVGQFGKAYLTVPAAVIVGREIVISALREWMAEIGKRTSVAVGLIGKFKTTLQMLSLILLIICRRQSPDWLKYAGIGLLYIAAILTLWSMFMYLKAAWPDLTLSSKKE
jgi:CDP-diacylglycerol---glycerol-3-phosphate 3-phosphatidyltransferase